MYVWMYVFMRPRSPPPPPPPPSQETPDKSIAPGERKARGAKHKAGDMIKRYLGEQKVEGEMDSGPEWGPECLGPPVKARPPRSKGKKRNLHLIQCDDCDHIQYDKRQDTPNKRSMSCGKCAGNRLAYVHRAGPYNAGAPLLQQGTAKHQFWTRTPGARSSCWS